MDSYNKLRLTDYQEAVFLLGKHLRGTNVNDIVGKINISDLFNIGICERILNKLVENNDMLRTRIVEENDEVFQIIDEYKCFDIDVKEFSDKETVDSYIKYKISQPIDVLCDKLYDFTILKYNENEGAVIVKVHHIVSDAWSFSQISTQFSQLYKDEVENISKEYEIPSYKEFIEANILYKKHPKYLADECFWKEYLDGVGTPISLKKHTKNIDNKAKRYEIKLSKEKTSKIDNYCKDNKISVFSLFLTALAVYVYRVIGVNDFLLGTPILNRSNARQKKMLGMFISTIPLRIKVDEGIKFLDLAKSIGSSNMSIFRHQKYPIVKNIDFIHKNSHIAGKIFNIVFSYQNANYTNNGAEYISSEWLFSGTIQNELEMHIMNVNNENLITIMYDYLSGIFNEVEIKYLHSRLLCIIMDAIQNEQADVENIKIMSSLEENKVLYEFNNTKFVYPKSKTVVDLFEEQLIINPKAVAINDCGVIVTYEELEKRANDLAYFLSDKKGENIIVSVKNSIKTLISIYGILKSGNTYVPIDISTPKDRIDNIIKNSNAKYIISDDIYEDLENIYIDNLVNSNTKINNSNANDVAYIIYTSGTTGFPKGVRILNSSLTNYITWAKKVYQNGNRITMPLFTSIGFDLTVTTIFLPITSGGTVVITPNNIYDVFNTKGLNTIKLTPAHLSLINDDIKQYADVKTLILGGEALRREQCFTYTEYNENVSIFNEYGPTEATVGCMTYKFNKNVDTSTDTIKIGKPADNCSLFVMNDKRQLLPLGCEGELYISGDGVSIGYNNLPEKNSEVFVEGMYKTGDIVRLPFDMNMEYVGRYDTQVKINGYRIELEEISNLIAEKFAVRNIHVNTLSINGSKSICVYYVSDQEILKKDFRKELRKYLPTYMIPNLYFKIDEIPLNINGKVDLRALEKIDTRIGHHEYSKSYKNRLEKIMCKIVCEILEIDGITPEDDIFEFGMDSLKVAKCERRLAEYEFSIKSLQSFYDFPIIREFCENLLSENKNNEKKIDSNLLKYKKVFLSKRNLDKTEVATVLLTGATGYLGCHILKELIFNDTVKKVYCIVRGNYYKERLVDKFKYYFKELDLNNFKKVEIIKGNLEKVGLDVPPEVLKETDVIINSAAKVEHNGYRKEFEKANVKTVKNIIDLCLEYNIILEHISTMSVFASNSCESLEENDFYVGQDFTVNPYIESKFKAEALIYENIEANFLKANVYRMGNLSWRYSDGKFQSNAMENAFLLRLKNISEIGVYSKKFEQYELEFSPVDISARNVIDIILNQKCTVNNIYHVYNNKTVMFREYIELLKKHNIPFEKVKTREFVEAVRKHDKKHNILYNELANNINFINNNFKNDITNSKLLTQWPSINEKYLEYMFKYF